LLPGMGLHRGRQPKKANKLPAPALFTVICGARSVPPQLSHPHPHYLLSLTARADLYQIARSAINRFFANPWILSDSCENTMLEGIREEGSPLSSRDQERKKQDAKGRNQQKKSRAHKNRTTVLLQQTNKSGICLNYLSVQFCS
jgi:hypothetical protein